MLQFERRTLRWAIAALAFSAAVSTAQAGPVAYTGRAAFDAAVAALAGVSVASDGFEGSAAGTLIADGSTLRGLTYHYGGPLAGSGVSLTVGSGFGTTSGTHFLGTDDGNLFQSGDDFALGFAAARALGMYFISHDPLFDGDITLAVGGVVASLQLADEQPFGLVDGKVYFLGLVDAAGSFSTASIGSFCSPCGSFLFNIDDIVTARDSAQAVPAPATLTLAILGLTACGALSRRRGTLKPWQVTRVSTGRT